MIDYEFRILSEVSRYIIKNNIKSEPIMNEKISNRIFTKKYTDKLNKIYFKSLKKIDTLILVTQSPDYFLPTSACVLQNKIGLSKKTKCFDVNQGCSGYIYGLSIASAYIESHLSENVLLV